MKKIIYTAIVAIAAISTSNIAMAQSYGGAALDHDIMMSADFASLSQTQVFGSARSMAMGGAFTSLGADISSVNINPAGLGMYSQGVVSITPMVSITNAPTEGVPSWRGDSKSSFGFSNIGATFKISERAKGSLITLNAAFTYNKLADYNSKTSFSSETLYNRANNNLVPSIVDVFMGQLVGAGIYPGTNDSMDYDNNPYFWPAQSAYKTFLIDPTSDDSNWGTNVIGHNASVLSSYEVWQKGRTDEYSFALGGNISNVLYFGATLGIQGIKQATEYTYQEEYNYYDEQDGGFAYATIDDDTPLAEQAQYSNLWQKTELSGSGVNLKLGLIARPVRALRIGVAYHSPTYYSIARSYITSTETKLLDNEDLTKAETITSISPEFIDNYENSWQFRTPSKLLLGGSLQIGRFGIISLDYERQWYNWTRVSFSPGEYTPYDYMLTFKDSYKPTNTFRAGLEIKPISRVALRAGAGYTSSMVSDESMMYSSPVATDSNYFTLGLGFQLSSTTSLDFAYQYYHQNYTSYRLFYAEYDDGTSSASNLFNTSLNRNYIAATLTFKM